MELYTAKLIHISVREVSLETKRYDERKTKTPILRELVLGVRLFMRHFGLTSIGLSSYYSQSMYCRQMRESLLTRKTVRTSHPVSHGPFLCVSLPAISINEIFCLATAKSVNN